MNSASKHAVTALLVFSVAGCAPKNTKTAPPAQAQAPSIPAGKAGAEYPPPLTESQTQAQPAAPPPAPVVAQTQPEPAPPPTPPPSPKKTSHKAKPSAAKPAGTENGSTQTASSETTGSSGSGATDSSEVAASSEPGAASPIGELTPGDTPAQAQKSKDTGDLIAKTEDGLNSIKHPLSTQEQETVNQIRAFLTKARTALNNQDFDGAFILATKAKVLLDELNKT